MSGDSELSASELQRRYHKGGTVQDDELTAAQLRARHGIAGNRADFSTGDKGADKSAVMLLGAIFVVVIILGGIVYFSKI